MSFAAILQRVRAGYNPDQPRDDDGKFGDGGGGDGSSGGGKRDTKETSKAAAESKKQVDRAAKDIARAKAKEAEAAKALETAKENVIAAEERLADAEAHEEDPQPEDENPEEEAKAASAALERAEKAHERASSRLDRASENVFSREEDHEDAQDEHQSAQDEHAAAELEALPPSDRLAGAKGRESDAEKALDEAGDAHFEAIKADERADEAFKDFMKSGPPEGEPDLTYEEIQRRGDKAAHEEEIARRASGRAERSRDFWREERASAQKAVDGDGDGKVDEAEADEAD